MTKKSKTASKAQTAPYKHPEAESPMRPEVGTQAQFKKKKPPKTYRYDSSLSPALEWDGTEPGPRARRGTDPANPRRREPRRSQSGRMRSSRPSAAVPELGRQGRAAVVRRADPAAVRPRAALHQGHHRDAGGPQARQARATCSTCSATRSIPITDQVLQAYEYRDNWVNRMILGDSLVVMNSLLHYEGLGGQVQMIYMDPPYGVKFGSQLPALRPQARRRATTTTRT